MSASPIEFKKLPLIYSARALSVVTAPPIFVLRGALLPQHCHDMTVHPCTTIEAAQALAQRLTSRKVQLPVVQQQPGKRSRPVPRPPSLLPASQGFGGAALAGDECLPQRQPVAVPEAEPRSASDQTSGVVSSPLAVGQLAGAEAGPVGAGCGLRTGGETELLASASAVQASGCSNGTAAPLTGAETVSVAASEPEAAEARQPRAAAVGGGASGSPLAEIPLNAGTSAGKNRAAVPSGAAPRAPRRRPAPLPDSGAPTADVISDPLLPVSGAPDVDKRPSAAMPKEEQVSALLWTAADAAPPSVAASATTAAATALPETLAPGKRAAKRQRRMQRQAEMAAASSATARAQIVPTALDKFMWQTAMDPASQPAKRRKA